MQALSFKQQLAADNKAVFLNPLEFGDLHTVIYDGVRYEDIPIVLSGPEEADRQQLAADHGQGLYRVSAVLYCAAEDLAGQQPEQGGHILINDEAGGGGFFREYYVASSICEMGMLEVELEAIDE